MALVIVLDLHYTVQIIVFCKVNVYTYLFVCCCCHGNHARAFVYILGQGHRCQGLRGQVPIPTPIIKVTEVNECKLGHRDIYIN